MKFTTKNSASKAFLGMALLIAVAGCKGADSDKDAGSDTNAASNGPVKLKVDKDEFLYSENKLLNTFASGEMDKQLLSQMDSMTLDQLRSVIDTHYSQAFTEMAYSKTTELILRKVKVKVKGETATNLKANLSVGKTTTSASAGAPGGTSGVASGEASGEVFANNTVLEVTFQFQDIEKGAATNGRLYNLPKDGPILINVQTKLGWNAGLKLSVDALGTMQEPLRSALATVISNQFTAGFDGSAAYSRTGVFSKDLDYKPQGKTSKFHEALAKRVVEPLCKEVFTARGKDARLCTKTLATAPEPSAAAAAILAKTQATKLALPTVRQCLPTGQKDGLQPVYSIYYSSPAISLTAGTRMELFKESASDAGSFSKTGYWAKVQSSDVDGAPADKCPGLPGGHKCYSLRIGAQSFESTCTTLGKEKLRTIVSSSSDQTLREH